MRNNHLVIVDSTNILEFYDLGTGDYNYLLSEGPKGTWGTFSGGGLDGLTLAYLKTNPVGTHDGMNYRFLGNSEFLMYFEVNAVPEPSTALFALGSLSVVARRRRRS